MKPVKMTRPGDCLACAVAAVLEIDPLSLPSANGGDWDKSYQEFRAAVAKLGWRLTYWEWPEDKPGTLGELAATEFDPPDRELVHLVSVTHPSFRGEAHVIVMRGAEVIFDPGGDEMQRPPLDELVLSGGFQLNPLDPAEWQRKPRSNVTITVHPMEEPPPRIVPVYAESPLLRFRDRR